MTEVERGPLGDVARAADGTYTVRFERRSSHPPERVWAALTDPDEARHWFVEMTMEPGPGGRLHFDFEEQGEANGEVLTWEPPHLLEYSWTEAGATSRVRWELTAEGGGTLLTLTHTGLVSNPHEYGAGWHDFLDRLGAYLVGDEMPPLDAAFEALLEQYREHVEQRV